MIDYGAVLIIGHFIVSVFNVPLGNPLYQFIPYPSIEICEQYKGYHTLPAGGYSMSIEYKMHIQLECMTKDDFLAALEAQQQQQQQPPAEPDQSTTTPQTNDNWWSQ